LKNIAPKVDGTSTLSAEAFNSMASELENAVTVSGQTLDGTAEDAPDPNPTQIARSMSWAALTAASYRVVTRTGNNYNIAPNGAWAAPVGYVEGQAFKFRADFTSTGVTTINVTGLGAVTLKKGNGTDIVAGDLVSGEFYTVVYDSVSGFFILVGGAAGGGSGSGSGEKNYITNPNNSLNWGTSAGTILVATESSAANLPDNSTQPTGIRFTRVSGSAYAYYRFTLDAVDYNKKLKIQLDQAYAGAAGDYTVRVFSNTASAYNGTSTELTVAATTSLPSGVGQQQRTFDTPGAAAPYIEVRVYGNAGTTPLYVNNFLVGPGVIGQVPALGAVAYTPAFGNFGTVTGASLSARRVGEYLHISGRFTAGTPVAAVATLSLPTGLTILAPGGNFVAGKWSAPGATPTANTVKQGTVVGTSGASILNFSLDDYTSAQNPLAPANATVVLPTGGTLAFDGEIVVPIAEWAGSGTLNSGAGAQVEYVYNSSTDTNASDTTSFATGAEGALIRNITAVISRRVRFSTPIQGSDAIAVQVSFDRVQWFDVDKGMVAGGVAVQSYNQQSAQIYGFGRIRPVVSSDTDVDIDFGQYAQGTGTTYASAGTAWSAGAGSYFWRVSKVTASSPVGFGLATATDSGLVSGNGGYPGNNTGAAVPAGKIGEVVPSTIVSQTGTTTETDLAGSSITLTPGTWELVYGLTCQISSGTGVAQYALRSKVTTAANVNVPGTLRTAFIGSGATTAVAGNNLMPMSLPLVVATTTTYKIRITTTQPAGTGGSAVIYNDAGSQFSESVFYAKRIG